MIVLIIVICIAIGVVINTVKEKNPFYLAYLLFAMVPMIFWAPFEGDAGCATKTMTGYHDVPIVSLRGYDKSTLSGSGCFLGWGVSGSSREQYVVMEERDGMMRRKYIDASIAYVQEVDTDPCVRYEEFDKTYSIWLFGPWRWGKVDKRQYTNPCIIQIPKGSVIRNFEEV